MTVRDRTYRRCLACEATFLLPEQLPSPEAERRRYDQHNNDPGDPRYVAFLRRLADPLLERLGRACADGTMHGPLHGLDFGSGPEPVLAELIREAGHTVACYDPFYAPDRVLLSGEKRYDFITCCEVAEHLHAPADEFDRLKSLLRPAGILAIMTEFQTEDARFARWYYREDRTHVVFFRETTFIHLGERLGMTVEIPHRNVVLLQKSRRRRSFAAERILPSRN